MKKKRKVLLITVMAIAVLLTGIYFGICQAEPLGFGIYLSENDEQIISDKDIIWYDRASHRIKLTEEGAEKILALKVPVHGKGFVVKLGRKIIYTGSFWTSFSSIPYSGVVIIREFPFENNVIEINLGYPTPDEFVGTDPRNDNEIFDYLQKIGKLI